jgi:hypothetical protein
LNWSILFVYVIGRGFLPWAPNNAVVGDRHLRYRHPSELSARYFHRYHVISAVFLEQWCGVDL